MPRRTAAVDRRAERDALDPRIPLHERVQEALRRRVEEGEFSPSAPLPAEGELAGEYDVSLGTMRRALAGLASEGLLERRQGDGTYLRRARMDGSLFRFFRHGADTDAVPGSRIVDRSVTGADVQVAEALGCAAGAEVLHLRRHRLRGDVPFLVEDIWLPLPRFAALVERPLDSFADLLYPMYESDCGSVVASASEEVSVGAAAAAEAPVLGGAEGDPVVIVERCARLHNGEVIEFRRTRGAAAGFRYRVEIR
jgi:GntR family transcriptional regulator